MAQSWDGQVVVSPSAGAMAATATAAAAVAEKKKIDSNTAAAPLIMPPQVSLDEFSSTYTRCFHPWHPYIHISTSCAL